MVATQVTEESMMVAGMSAHMSMSDQYMTLMGMPQAAFMAVGSDEAGLVLMNADTVTAEKMRIALQEQEEDDEASFDIVSDMALAEMKKRLERLSEPVTVGDITLTQEEWEQVEDTLKDPEGRNAVIERMMAQGYSEAEALHAILVAEAMARIAKDKFHGREPSAADQALVDDAQKDPRARAAARDAVTAAKDEHARVNGLNTEESYVQAEFQSRELGATADAVEALVEDKDRASDIINVKEGASFGGNAFFADMKPVSEPFETAVNEEVKVAEATPAPTVSSDTVLKPEV